jgi:hypothetical protein
MRAILTMAAICALATPALAQGFPAEMAAAYFNEEMSIPKGWKLNYSGRDGATYVFSMDRDLDAAPQTAFLQPIDQMHRLMCGDETLKGFVKSGVVVRVDTRDKQGGKTTTVRGPTLSSC